jgi:hypothetical protein
VVQAPRKGQGHGRIVTADLFGIHLRDKPALPKDDLPEMRQRRRRERLLEEADGYVPHGQLHRLRMLGRDVSRHHAAERRLRGQVQLPRVGVVARVADGGADAVAPYSREPNEATGVAVTLRT